MKRDANKSRCPINFTVELFGDTWSLLILRDMAALGKNTFGQFLESEERIGPSVLAERLAHLEQKGIITKRPSETDKRRMLYSFTEKGMGVIPIIYDFAVWGSLNSPDPDAPDVWFEAMKHEREKVLQLWHEAVAAGSSFFIGPESVVRKLNLA